MDEKDKFRLDLERIRRHLPAIEFVHDLTAGMQCQEPHQVEERCDMSKGRPSNIEKHRRMEEHKAEIVADLREIGISKTLAKWKIGLSTFYDKKRGLIKIWGIDLASLPKLRGGAKKKAKADEPPATIEPDYKQMYRELQKEYDAYRLAVRDIFGGHA